MRVSAPLGLAVRDAAREQLRRELAVRLTASHDAVLRRVPDLYRRIIGEALLAEDGQTGKAAQLRTAQRALDRIARIGVVDFTDTSGRRWNMQSYVEMAVRSAALRAMITAQMRVYRDRGISLVRVSDHAGGCPLCAPFEGRLLAIDAMPTEPVTDRSGSRVEVVATVAEAIAAGLHHPNCRHRTAPFIPGVTVMPPPQPHDPTEYADQQRLRALERQVRAWRRREAAAITPEARETARRKVTDWQGAIREHVAATDVRRLRDREQISRPLTSPTPRRRVDQAIADVDRAARDAAESRRLEVEQRAREEAERQAAAERAAQQPSYDGLTYTPPRVVGSPSPERLAFLRRFTSEALPQVRGAMAYTRIVTDPATGERMVFKDTRGDGDSAEAEVLGMLIGDAVGARVPRVRRLDRDAVAMEFIPGDTMGTWLSEHGDIRATEAAWYSSPEVTRLAVMDYLATNADRNLGNAMIGPDGTVWGIDHGQTLSLFYAREGLAGPTEQVYSEFGTRPWERPDVTADMLAEIGPRLAALRPHFATVGGDALMRHDILMERFRQLTAEVERRDRGQ